MKSILNKYKEYYIPVLLAIIVLFCTLIVGGWKPNSSSNDDMLKSIDQMIDDAQRDRVKLKAYYYDHTSGVQFSIVSIDSVEYVINKNGGIFPLIKK